MTNDLPRLGQRGAPLWPFGVAVAGLVLILGCVPDREAETALEVSPAPAEPQVTASPPASPSTEAASGAPETAGQEPAAPSVPAMPGGLEAAPGIRSDPNLASSSAPPGRATARWGDRGPSTESSSPWRSLARDGIHAADSDAIGFLQEPRSALRSMPRQGAGNYVDWVAALRSGAIRPRARVGSAGSMETLDRNVLFANTKNMPTVTFPHLAHTEWLSCRNCHDWLFKAQLGANDFNMTDIARGRACGLCHGKVAFPATECFRCHNGPRPGG